MRFIGGQARKYNKSLMLARFSSLPYGCELFEGNIHDQNALPISELTKLKLDGMPIILVSPLDPKGPWDTLIEL